ncbi:efflux RND transporter permease subunit [Microvirga pudoricolor]|uniref:efflux RND transporter permease subunit n=1 Tax=Microvirga pudoricolor TaxID=2778729 RepID=UPI001950C75B|nr:efflux RND transporter permease subunit [Microvirga pudoricolor]MBM6595167.1 efflux RND transporter permease subunit [Microvirga pudoricolor]
MNISEPFIRRPIGTFLMAVGLLLSGLVAYLFLPVASLPSVDFPTIRVSASLPGADPEVMAATVAAPLERHLGTIAGVTELTSTSALGSTNIAIQFELSRNVDDAARDVQAAITAARADLPSSLSQEPRLRKFNPAAFPILSLTLTSKNRLASELYDIADLIVATRIAQTPGVAEVTVGGADQPAFRVAIDPAALEARGIGMEAVRTAITGATSLGPNGRFDGPDTSILIGTNSQIATLEDFSKIVLKADGGNIVRLTDVAKVEAATRNSRTAGGYNRQPAVTLMVQKTSEANVVETVKRVRDLLPELNLLIPADTALSVVNDRTTMIQASVDELQLTLGLSVLLVMLVVYVFLRRGVPTAAAGVTVPLSLAGTVALMWLSGFSLNNMSLLALTISVGFVVDDAIVMIENCYRNMEAGLKPYQAALLGARQIGFTVISISLSLIAAFIPILFMGGVTGRILQEFSLTLTYAVVMSAVVSLTVTPMICGRFIRTLPRPRQTALDRLVEPVLEAVGAFYARTLDRAFGHKWLMLLITLGAVGLTAGLYVSLPKAILPRGDTGLIMGFARASPDTSFQAMTRIDERVMAVLMSDPAVSGVSSTVGGSGFGSGNQVRYFLNLKPLEERKLTAEEIIARLRPKLAEIVEAQVTLFPPQEITIGARGGRSQYQVTLWSTELAELTRWVPRAVARIRTVPGVLDVNTDREQGGPEAYVRIDRTRASQLGVSVRDITAVLNDSFSQRQVATLYRTRNQYRIILEVDPNLQRDVTSLGRLFVSAGNGTQVPLSSVASVEFSSAPLVVNHQRQFPSATISFNIAEDAELSVVTPEIERALMELHMPEAVRVEFAGDAGEVTQTQSSQVVLILAALITVYLVLGILYENLIHPLTILSTLPSAGLGALLTLWVTGTSLSLIALIGIMLLIGIVKKNGIMLVDFAIEAQRSHGLSAEAAIREACMARFRPITMTTLAALLGALPLVLATGPGAELRWPLGITIIGGLVMSQILTIYTTPIIYLMLDRLRPTHGRLSAKLAGEPVRSGDAGASSGL